MSERKRGGLDYTPRAFPGARDPDGPAPDLASKLAKLGLIEGSEASEAGKGSAQQEAGAETKPSGKQRGGLDYTPRAFPGARDPDGPAPGLEERLIKSGWAEPAARSAARPDARPDIRPGANIAPPQERKERTAPPPVPEATIPVARMQEPAPTSARESASVPAFSALAQPRQPSRPAGPPAATVAPPSAPPTVEFDLTRLPRVPSEPVPRPAPIIDDSPPGDLGAEIPARAAKPVTTPAPRAARGPVRVRRLADKEERTRLSLRLASTVDQKLDDLAHLRGLDRNTAVCVAIVQDWIACFGLQARQAGH